MAVKLTQLASRFLRCFSCCCCRLCTRQSKQNVCGRRKKLWPKTQSKALKAAKKDEQMKAKAQRKLQHELQFSLATAYRHTQTHAHSHLATWLYKSENPYTKNNTKAVIVPSFLKQQRLNMFSAVCSSVCVLLFFLIPCIIVCVCRR